MLRRSKQDAFTSLGMVLALLTIFPTALRGEDFDFFEKKIRPIFTERCYECHSSQSKKVKGGFLLDTREALLKGGETGSALVPGKPEKSLLITAVRYADKDLQMPPKHQLAPQQIKDLEAWVKMGAPDPRRGGSNLVATAEHKSIDFAQARKFWSFQPLKDPAPPHLAKKSWAWNAVDRFILAAQEQKGLSAVRDADKRTLIRRATYDLIGLPPTPEEVEAFLADKSTKSFGKVV
ncbi:MAG TPA: c-type cytochrome domain-containing protein, partial [Verrucomicrobiae bacterium]|nr:c-type cytochrome domain-containing protein [Verrucomicrobiae bacterium]